MLLLLSSSLLLSLRNVFSLSVLFISVFLYLNVSRIFLRTITSTVVSTTDHRHDTFKFVDASPAFVTVKATIRQRQRQQQMSSSTSRIFQQQQQQQQTQISDDINNNNRTSTIINSVAASSTTTTTIRERNNNHFLRHRHYYHQDFYEYYKAASGSFGDIMARASSSSSTRIRTNVKKNKLLANGLTTTHHQPSSGSLANQFNIRHPLDRMALTANGNLQRLVSSYYDAPVNVIVEYCKLQQPTHPSDKHQSHAKTWDRFALLRVYNHTFGTAHSVITVHDPICQELVESGEIGLGQLFRYLDILPEFELHDAGPFSVENTTTEDDKNTHEYESGGFWREYSLHCPQMHCQIYEEFTNIWNIEKPTETET